MDDKRPRSPDGRPLKVEILLAGVDDDGGRICFVGNPGGSYTEFGQIGFTAIGSGALHAIQSMIGFQHTGGRGLHDTVFSVYVSKRRAEAAPGVGQDTDLAIVTQGGITRLTPETLQGLDEIYREYQAPAKQAVTDKVAALNLFHEGGDDAATTTNQ